MLLQPSADLLQRVIIAMRHLDNAGLSLQYQSAVNALQVL